MAQGQMDKEINKILRPIVLLICLMIFFSVLFQMLMRYEGREVSLLRCFYMVTITVSTVGYEDLLGTKDSNLLMLFTIISIMLYMVAVAYTISNFTAFLVEGRLKRYFLLKRTLKRIKKMDQHYIICGIKDIGVFTAKELHKTKRPFVVIEENAEAIEELSHEIGSLVSLQGDPTDDHLLKQAGIEKAQALIGCLEDDKDNLYLVLAAKELNPEIKIAAKCNLPKNQKKLLKAGASYLVSPHMIGGLRIASELIRPYVVSFLDRMLRDEKEIGVRLEDMEVQEGAAFVGKTFSDLYQKSGILIIAYHNPKTGDFKYNPDPKEIIEPKMVLIFIGIPENRIALQKLLS